MEHERHVTQLQPLDERAEIGRLVLGPIPGAMRPVGKTETDVVQRDAAVVRGQSLDEVAPEEGPVGRAVDEDQWPSLPFVHVVQAPRG